jgi:cellulose synthase/poly-beta-1,6-N-acetylglucosamine synthase-like glycosyltransferase
MQALFWILLLGSAYSYFIYPALLWLLSRGRVRQSADAAASAAEWPSLTLIVTAYNEEKRIRAKIQNTLAIDYPRERLELIVASDCSSDATEAIAAEYATQGVRVVRAAERLGKENAQLTALRQANGEILVFSDVATEIPPDSLRKLARYFDASDVGAVSSEDRFIGGDGVVAGEGAYVRYEMWLRRMESGLAGLVGLSGSFFAARKRICEQWDILSPSDFNTALNCARAGMRAVTSPDVLGYYKDLQDPHKEYQRKVRTVLRGITAIARHPDVLNPLRFGAFAWQVWSHKVMRWLVPYFLAALFVVSVLLAAQGGIYLAALLGQLAFYGVALLAHFSQPLRRHAVPKLIYFFVQVNISLAEASLRFLSGQRMATWQPSAR